MSTVSVLRDPERLEPLRDEWRRLAELAGNAYVTPEWLDACLARPPATPAVVEVRSADGALRGVLPLVADGAPGALRWLRFPGDDLGDTFTMLVAPGDDAAAVGRLAGRALAEAGALWSALALCYVDEDALWLAGLLDGLGGLRPMRRGRVVRPYVDLAAGDWTEYLAGLKRGDRKETRRRERRVLDAGGRFTGVARPEEVGEGIEALFRLHDLRWAEESSLTAPSSRALLRAFAVAAAERGWTRLWFLEMGGERVAAELAWRIGGRQLHYQGGFDPAQAALGVGMVLFAHGLQDGIEAGVREADLGMGESLYKKRYAQHQRTAALLIVMRRWHPLRPGVAAALWGRRTLSERLSPERRARVSRLLKRR
jgi:CelD/BcsL family acetyltransferase involved in cellulose biosynthesis